MSVSREALPWISGVGCGALIGGHNHGFVATPLLGFLDLPHMA